MLLLLILLFIGFVFGALVGYALGYSVGKRKKLKSDQTLLDQDLEL